MDATPSYPLRQAQNPFRPPDWRWRRAEWLLARGRYVSRKRDDEVTGKAVHYLRAHARCRHAGNQGAPARRYPDIAAADQLHGHGGDTRVLIEARLLAGQTPAEVARLTGVPAEVVDTYEALFFCCRDHLAAVDWVVVRAIGKRLHGPAPDAGTALKLFAYFGGPLALDAVLPFLLGDQSASASPPDLSTAQGRCEQAIRLAVVLTLLPEGALGADKLFRLHLDLFANNRLVSRTGAFTPLLAQDLDLNLEIIVAEALRGRADTPATHVRCEPERDSRQTA